MTKKIEVRKSIGDKKLRIIEEATKDVDIERITQLLNIDGIGDSVVIKVSKIIGFRFARKDKCHPGSTGVVIEK